ncbi:hypothetical protein K435DRAFT_654700 [Dendrothele bispora CBS 962.96]|uniref:HAT C-terminal dimerisation domain-containing protein n=1 Tax=Dendrothele bispora (strain CBS 962.96) TaxID=1314807 RepID=A0A4S8MGH8_DENBC|nr:hypothetical protein K435DRAFT_654700 [Dendrothele bispora CBS 962.96]
MIKSLETILLDCPAGPSTHVHCMRHTIQLLVGLILDPFKAVQKWKIGNVIVEVDEDAEVEEDYADDALLDGGGSDEEDEPMDGDEDEDDEDHGNNDNEKEGEEQNDQPLSIVISEGEWKNTRAIVRKVCLTLAQKIHWSESLRVELKAHCKREHITFKTVKWIVKTRWNIYAIMFESVLHLCKALDRLCKSHPHNLPHLDTQEWELLQGLYDMLNVSFPFIPVSFKA